MLLPALQSRLQCLFTPAVPPERRRSCLGQPFLCVGCESGPAVLLAIVVTRAAVLYGKPVVLIVVLCFALCDCVIPVWSVVAAPFPSLTRCCGGCGRPVQEVPGPPGFPFMKLL